MQSFLVKIAVLAFAVAFTGSTAYAQGDADKTGKELESVKQQLEQSAEREKQINRELTSLEKEARQISNRLIELAAKTQAREDKISGSERQITRLNQRERQLVQKLSRKRAALGELLIGLQRLERNPPPPLVAHKNDALAAVRSATLFGAIIPAIKAETTTIRLNLTKLASVRASLKTAQKDLENNFQSLFSVRNELTRLLERKKKFVTKTRKQLDNEKKRTARLVAKASNLEQLLERIKREKQEAEKRQKLAAQRQANRRKIALLKPNLAFIVAKGTLSRPARGKLVARFHEKNKLGTPYQGELLATRKLAQITSPVNGIVEFAGRFRSYGLLLILNVGDGYRMLLGGLGKVDVSTGQAIRAGEPLGSMGNEISRGTLITASLDVHQPVLYIEFRNKSGPVDPSSWWRSNIRKAQN